MPSDINWLLQDFINRTPGVMAVVVTSADGLRVASENLPDNAAAGKADHLSAVSSGMHSLAKGVSRDLDDGSVAQTIIQMGSTVLYIMAAGSGAILTVLGDPGEDAAQIAYAMALLVKQMPQNLSVPDRLAPAGLAHARG
ncbi:roadblock/LC7 domain-containing protein [Streptomyces sp. CSDS2]|uniref:roadblock/LC7 domain-containing protein n=1 Tax=Streptomyces sp. CSDS2 TaxID=3055051 RepID=UPI0025AFFD54|nr:roadblock/LC7 domain-containing protein [Streptomyces sp. CSDS2]MDN3260802.1 roadblock/LC7 domain-containing protein [Streptomyces sp. CSDS2]